DRARHGDARALVGRAGAAHAAVETVAAGELALEEADLLREAPGAHGVVRGLRLGVLRACRTQARRVLGACLRVEALPRVAERDPMQAAAAPPGVRRIDQV